IRAVATSDFLAMLGPGGGRAPRAREVEVRGVRIGSLEFPPGPFAEHGIEVHFAAREGFLVLSSSRPLLERMLSARGPSLAERPGVANAFAGAGGTDGGFASWLDERAAMRG